MWTNTFSNSYKYYYVHVYDQLCPRGCNQCCPEYILCYCLQNMAMWQYANVAQSTYLALTNVAFLLLHYGIVAFLLLQMTNMASLQQHVCEKTRLDTGSQKTHHCSSDRINGRYYFCQCHFMVSYMVLLHISLKGADRKTNIYHIIFCHHQSSSSYCQ